MMQIAVTAASGRLGQATLKALSACADAANIIGVARDPGRIDVPGIDKRAGDYESVEQMTAALKGIDTVVMISAPAITGTDRIKMHRNVIEAAKQAGVRKVIYTSVIGGPEAEGTRFAKSQQLNRQAEADLAVSGLEWIIARNGLYLELDLGHIIRANESGVYRNNGGDGRCGYISIDELAFATAALATSDACNGRILNLTSENKTQAELVELANEVFGLHVRYEPITVEQNIERFMADEKIAARGEEVVNMLSGCFECIEQGAFDVPGNFSEAAGRAPKSIREQFEEIRARG
jgi:NAD(P)H dehydrogenase (quinone)